MDAEAQSEWSLNQFALVEAAGRRAAGSLLDSFPRLFREAPSGPSTVILAGAGNNGADAMVILRSLIFLGKLEAEKAALLVTKIPGGEEENPRSLLYRSLLKLGVPAASALDGEQVLRPILEGAALIIDGLSGTGLRGALRGEAAALAALANSRRRGSLLVSVDVPSGLSDDWKPGMPLVEAGATLALEPEKLCLYKPAARPFCGRVLHTGGIFPEALTEKYRAAELVDWDYSRTLIPPVPPDSYKYGRGLVEIRAGAPGSSGAAAIAARGAQAAGAGLVRLLVDPAIQSVLAVGASGIMVAEEQAAGPRFKADALLLGPGWGRGPERRRSLEEALALEEGGTPLVLDADAIHLAKDRVFHGNALLTPHPGELAAYTGLPREEILSDPARLLPALAREKRAVFLFKSHVLFIASPAGDLAVVDGMNPSLAVGGSGDLLAGLCAGIAARRRAMAAGCRPADLYACALAGAGLLIRAAGEMANRFTDPLELADLAADLAGRAWLPGSPGGGTYG
jgi:NAD(P)H-hydrate epimerase